MPVSPLRQRRPQLARNLTPGSESVKVGRQTQTACAIPGNRPNADKVLEVDAEALSYARFDRGPLRAIHHFLHTGLHSTAETGRLYLRLLCVAGDIAPSLRAGLGAKRRPIPAPTTAPPAINAAQRAPFEPAPFVS